MVTSRCLWKNRPENEQVNRTEKKQEQRTKTTKNEKMKSIQFLTTIIASLALIGPALAQGPVTSPTTATPPPASLPTQNVGKLRAYAFSEVAGGSSSVWGESIMWASSSTTNIYFRPQVKPSYEEVIRQLNTAQFSFKVADKSKPLTIFSDLFNKGGMNLFYGTANASVSSQGAILCAGVKMRMNSCVPIYVGPNVSSASIRTGNQRDNAEIWNGYLMFQEGYAEKDGLVVLDYYDGVESQEIAYSIPTGSRITLTSVSGMVNNYVQDYQFVNDDGLASNAILFVKAYGSVGDDHEAPVVCVKITSARSVKFSGAIYDMYTNDVIENPIGGGLIVNDTETEVSLTPGQWSAPMMLQPGTYYFYLKTGLYDVPTPVNYYEGGKGN